MKRKNTLIAVILCVIIAISGFSTTYAWQESENLHYAKGLSRAFVEVSKKVIPAVVSISTTKKVTTTRGGDLDDIFERYFNIPQIPREYRQQGLGSGFIISEDGYIVTNNHVVEGAEDVKVTLNDGMEYEAKIIGNDPLTDVALIKIEGKDFPYLRVGDSDKIEIGEWVIAVGTPLSEILSSTVTAGIVSARGRNIGIIRRSAESGYAVEDFIQTDAAINRGNSGGPLVNLDGEVIGVNSAIISETGNYQGYGFSIPINLAMATIEDLKKYGKVVRGYIGITITDIANQEQMKKYNLDKPEGVLINGLQPNSPAKEAGLEPGDVIIEVDGLPVKRSNQLQSRIASKDPGDKVKVKVLRDGKEKEFVVTLKAREEMGDIADTGFDTGDTYDVETLGLTVAEINNLDDLRDFYGQDITGVIVVKVANRSIAYEAGIKAGDIIYKIGRYTLKDIDDFERAINRYQSRGRRVTFYIINDRGTQLIPLRIPE